MSKIFRVASQLVGLLLVAFFSLAPEADANPYTPPEIRSTDFNGVDLLHSVLFKTQTLLTIGDPKSGGLAWSYSGVSNQDSFTGFLHYDTSKTPDGGEAFTTASMGEQSYTFYTGGTDSGRANYATRAHVG